jgi:catechol 2,3-dioxygenase-like lactoylglutathione lyase family enzyme
MIDHVSVGVADLAKAKAFTDAVPKPLGCACDNGKPGLRPHYHENDYGAFAFDLDGNKIEACSHHPEP